MDGTHLLFQRCPNGEPGDGGHMMRLTAFTTTSNVQASTGLVIPLYANLAYDLEFWGEGMCATVNGYKYQLDLPVGATMSGWLNSVGANSAVANWTTESMAVATPTSALHVGASAALRPDSFNVRVKMGASAGNAILKMASATNGDLSTLGAKAYMRATISNSI